jgi:hypothetical protein
MVGWPVSLKDAGSPFLIIHTATRVPAFFDGGFVGCGWVEHKID